MRSYKLTELIKSALIEVEKYTPVHQFEMESLQDTKTTLMLLKSEIFQKPESINERVLRAMHDIGMSSYKDFENTPLEKAINAITDVLYEDIPSYKNLKPLRNNFRK